MDVAPYCEMVLVMTVHPGFGGQGVHPRHGREGPASAGLVGPAIRIEVDPAELTPETVPLVVSGGADTLVAGSAIFGQQDRLTAVAELRNAIQYAEALATADG
jgi:ribulose-phosphate 3-epimerase